MAPPPPRPHTIQAHKKDTYHPRAQSKRRSPDKTALAQAVAMPPLLKLSDGRHFAKGTVEHGHTWIGRGPRATVHEDRSQAKLSTYY